MTCTACGTSVPPGVADCLSCGRAVPALSSVSSAGAAGHSTAGAGLGSLPPPGNSSFGGTPFGDPQFARLEDTSFADILFDGAAFRDTTVATRVAAPSLPAAAERPSTERGSRLALVAVLTVLVALVAAGVLWYLAKLGDDATPGINTAAQTGQHGLQQATDAQLRSDVRSGALAEQTYLTDYLTYTASVAALRADGLRVSSGDSFRVVAVHGPAGYCLAAAAPGAGTFYVSNLTGAVPTTNPCR